MDMVSNLALGFSVAVNPMNLFYCFIGVLMGTLVGVLPGVGTLVTMAVLLPLTFGLPTDGALIMLAGIYYGAQYGGSTTAILVNLPGESASAVTCIDGYKMARLGRAGPALAIAAIASFFAGCVGTLLIAALAKPIAALALLFRAPEYFSLIVLVICCAATLVAGSVFKGLAMVLLGVLLGTVGTDVSSGISRFTLDLPSLFDGINLAVVAMGLFAFGEIISNLEAPTDRSVLTSKIGRLMPSRDDFRTAFKPILRGTGIGSILGILPGIGPTISAYTAYMAEKMVSKTPERFGKGAIEGVASPEAANNAAAQTSFIPTLSLGVPHGGSMALLLGAFMIHGITPGPQVMTSHPDLFWGLIVSMWIGNLMLVILNLPLVGVWVSLLKAPYRWLFPAIIAVACTGLYTVNLSSSDILLAAAFGVLGYLFIKLDCEPAPLILGFVLGPMLEVYFRRAMLVSRGDPTVFITEPLSAFFLIAGVIVLACTLVPMIRRRKEVAITE
jgi:putative tricarboxylic transport membrane protein